MGQWSRMLVVEEAMIIAHVDCPPFVAACPGDLIDQVLLAGIKQWADSERARETVKRIEKQYVGRPYGDWLDACARQNNEGDSYDRRIV